MSNYLHGIEIKEGAKPVVIGSGSSGVIGLVGTALQGSNEVQLITNIEHARKEYGDDIGGFTIPSALELIFANTQAQVLVVNVLDKDDASALVTSGKMNLDSNKKWVSRIYEPALPSATDFTVEIIAGIEKLKTAENILGVKPDILIAPGYSQLSAVAGKLDEISAKLNASSYLDLVADNVQAALTKRADAGSLSKANIVHCFPTIKRYNAHEETTQEIGLSVAVAASKASGEVHQSPSNKIMAGVLGTSLPISASLTDSSADTNLLNAKGIVTVFSKGGYRVWGNWTSAYPSEKDTTVMIGARAMRMALRENLVGAAIHYMDKDVGSVLIDLILNSVNSYLNGLVGSGAIVAGVCKYDKKKGTAQDVAQGKLPFYFEVTYSPALDKLIFEEIVDTSALENLV